MTAISFSSLVNRQRVLDTFLGAARTWAPSGEEKAMADKVIKEYQDMSIPGLNVTVDDSAPRTGSNTGNVIIDIPATPGASKNAKAIGLFFHMDQVPVDKRGPEDLHKPVEVEVTPDGVIRSKSGLTNIGADDRCGFTEIKEAIQTIQENHIPHGKIRVIGFVKEETGLDGARELDRKYVKDLDYGFEVDAENMGEIMRGGASIYHWEAQMEGKSAHAGVHPDEGRSAVQAAALAIVNMGKIGKVSETQTLNPAYINGGTVGVDGNAVTNAIPDRAKVVGEFRGVTPDDLKSLQQTVEGSFEKASKATGVTYALKFEKMDGFYLDDQAPIVQFAEKATQSAGLAPDKTFSMGGIDGNYINAKGLPTVAIGDGGHNEHTEREYTTIDELVKGTELVMNLIALAAKPPITNTIKP